MPDRRQQIRLRVLIAQYDRLYDEMAANEDRGV